MRGIVTFGELKNEQLHKKELYENLKSYDGSTDIRQKGLEMVSYWLLKRGCNEWLV